MQKMATIKEIIEIMKLILLIIGCVEGALYIKIRLSELKHLEQSSTPTAAPIDPPIKKDIAPEYTSSRLFRRRSALILSLICVVLLLLILEIVTPAPLDRCSLFTIVFGTGALFFIMLHETIMNIVYAMMAVRGIK